MIDYLPIKPSNRRQKSTVNVNRLQWITNLLRERKTKEKKFKVKNRNTRQSTQIHYVIINKITLTLD